MVVNTGCSMFLFGLIYAWPLFAFVLAVVLFVWDVFIYELIQVPFCG